MVAFSKVSFEECLAKNVVATERCIGCGACVLVCPNSCLELSKEQPSLIKECKICGICAQACVQHSWSWSEAERFVFGREKRAEENFGIYRRLVAAQAKNEEILKAGQDGGVVTALLLFALENGLIDGAIVAGTSRERPFLPVPRLATTPEEILESAGTKYFYSPNLLALAEAAKQKKTSVAFVGTPCEIRAIRQLQMVGLRKYVAPIKYVIGLMCSECFTYEGLVEKHFGKTLGLNLNDIRKISIKGKMLITTESGVETVSLAETKQYARRSCRLCDDFSSELADISTGGLGLDGWTFTILRTEKGEELFSNAEKAGILNAKTVDEKTNTLNLLNKLSKKKREAQTVS